MADNASVWTASILLGVGLTSSCEASGAGRDMAPPPVSTVPVDASTVGPGDAVPVLGTPIGWLDDHTLVSSGAAGNFLAPQPLIVSCTPIHNPSVQRWGLDQRPFRISGKSLGATPRGARLSFEASGEFVQAPAIEVSVMGARTQWYDAMAYGGDLESEEFGLGPLLRSASEVIARAAPEVEAINYRLEGGVGQAPGYLVAERGDGWRLTRGRAEIDPGWQSKGTRQPFQPGPGLDGLIPTHEDLPNALCVVDGKATRPTRDWQLFYRSGVVRYGYMRGRTEPVVHVATIERCREATTRFDLLVSPSQFGGVDRAVESIAAEIDRPGSTPLSSIICGYLSASENCVDNGGRLPGDVVIRVADIGRADATLAELTFRYFRRPIPMPAEEFGLARRVLRLGHPALDDVRLDVMTSAELIAHANTTHAQSELVGFRGGPYLAALAARDFELLEQFDLRAAELLADTVESDDFGGWLDLLLMLDPELSTADAPKQRLVDAFLTLSLLDDLAGYYLMNYRTYYGSACFGGVEPARVVVKRILVERYDDGTGGLSEPFETDLGDRVYEVKPAFEPVLRPIATRSPEVSGVLFGLWRNEAGGLTPGELMHGARQMMKALPCDHPEVLAFEEGLLEYHARVKARMEARRPVERLR